MGLMDRFRRTDPVAPGTRDGGHHHQHHDLKNTGGVGANSQNAFVNQRPSFGAWIKGSALDLITMAAMGAIGLGIYEADPAPTRNFPVTFRDGEIVYPQFAYPLRKNIIPIWLAAFLAFFIPATFILVMQIRIRSFWDINAAIMGLLYSLITAAVFQVFLKWLIGGLRPHFLAVCKPDTSKMQGIGYGTIMYNRNICTGNKKDINDSLESFPSGHSTAAFAGFVFLFFYLNAKLKLWSNYHPAYWKMVVTYAPLLGATLIASSLTIDEFHNWYDCLAGAVIGTICAYGAYRMVYVAIWDWRYNHIPLPRGTVGGGVGFGGGQGGYGGFEHAVFTRKGGWGTDEGFGHHGGMGHHGTHNWGGQREYSAATATAGGPATMAPGPERV